MIVLEVLTANGVVPDPPIRALLNAGDSVGRAAQATLPLPDPERRVSRVHAQIAQRNGVASIIARGITPLIVDGQPLEMGEETVVAEGARIEIGGFVLRARLHQPKQGEG